jgi:hypothetical protein
MHESGNHDSNQHDNDARTSSDAAMLNSLPPAVASTSPHRLQDHASGNSPTSAEQPQGAAASSMAGSPSAVGSLSGRATRTPSSSNSKNTPSSPYALARIPDAKAYDHLESPSSQKNEAVPGVHFGRDAMSGLPRVAGTGAVPEADATPKSAPGSWGMHSGSAQLHRFGAVAVPLNPRRRMLGVDAEVRVCCL